MSSKVRIETRIKVAKRGTSSISCVVANIIIIATVIVIADWVEGKARTDSAAIAVAEVAKVVNVRVEIILVSEPRRRMDGREPTAF